MENRNEDGPLKSLYLFALGIRSSSGRALIFPLQMCPHTHRPVSSADAERAEQNSDPAVDAARQRCRMQRVTGGPLRFMRPETTVAGRARRKEEAS